VTVTGCAGSHGNLLNSSDVILVLTTGGTIDKQYFDALSEYQVGDSAVGKLLSVARVTHPHHIVEILRKDSLDFTEENRARIVEQVRQSVFRRIVITHGTDTMTLTAKALAVLSDKTIVLTGALTPARFAESDAAFNLGMAFATAQTAPPGVYITINGSVFRGEEVVKDREHQRFTAAQEP
jgi:L-asparaginase